MFNSRSNTKRNIVVFAVFGALFLGSACSSQQDSGMVAVSENFETSTTTEVIIETTSTTEVVTLIEPSASDFPQAIISLSATATEILFAIGAGDQVIAVDEYSTFPPEAPVTDLSGFTPNVEAIAEYDPDLVLISYDPGDLVAGLELLDIDVLVQGTASSLEETYSQIIELGEKTGHFAAAEELNASISTDLSSLTENPVGAGLTYFHEVDNTLYTATSSTFIGQLYALLGLENIADPADDQGFGYPQLSPEYIIGADPDLIFLADAVWGESIETLAERPGWAELTAIKNNRVVALDETSGRWGPRVVDFLTQIHSAITDLEN